MKTKITFWTCLLLLFIGCFFFRNSLTLAEDPKKLAILPFTMNADRDLTFLQNGIMDMLGSRLAWKDRVEVIEKGAVKKIAASVPAPLNKEKALKIGKELGADYVILGSLTVFGDSVSIDAKILDVAKAEELVTAFEQSKGMDGVIPTVNQFAEDINAKIMGKAVIRPEWAGQVEPEKGDRGALIEVGGASSDSRQRPSFVQRLKIEIRGLDVGDLDGDGKNEVVVIDRDKVYVYKFDKSRLRQSKVIEGGWGSNFVYVGVADINGNGRAEIFVSNLTTGVSSLVIEWDGARFKKIATGQEWLFRAVDLPVRGMTLLGQRRAVDGTYFGSVQALTPKGGGFASTGPLKLPKGGNVFNFVMSDLEGKGAVSTTMLGPYEHLLVYDQKGDRLWKSDDYFGGALTFMVDKAIDYNRMVDTGKRIFMPSPIFLYDIDADGKKEVVVCRNHSKAGRIFEDLRWFGSGKVHFMTWDGVGLATQWTSQKLTGTVVGYQVADIDYDGRNELIIACVTSESYFVGLPKSRLAVYDLK